MTKTGFLANLDTVKDGRFHLAVEIIGYRGPKSEVNKGYFGRNELCVRFLDKDNKTVERWVKEEHVVSPGKRWEILVKYLPWASLFM